MHGYLEPNLVFYKRKAFTGFGVEAADEKCQCHSGLTSDTIFMSLCSRLVVTFHNDEDEPGPLSLWPLMGSLHPVVSEMRFLAPGDDHFQEN